MLQWPLFKEPFEIVAGLLCIEGLVVLLSQWRPLKKVFHYLAPMFWIYFLPMVAATVGLFPAYMDPADPEHKRVLTATYELIGDYCLPASLVLLMLSVDLRGIGRLGLIALVVMLGGTLGTFIGGPVSLAIFKGSMPAELQGELWKGFGALSASWVGGSANMIAVGEAVQAPTAVFSPMVVVDTIVPYTWMALLIVMAGFQAAYDRWNRADARITDELIRRSATAAATPPQPLSLTTSVLLVALAVVGTLASQKLAAVLPVVPKMISPRAWAIIVASTLGLLLSFTPARRLEEYGASKLGYTLLYLVLAAIGVRTSLSHLAAAPVLILAGFVWIIIHGAVIMLVGRLVRAPLGLIATASQANIGGPASAPVVAGAYHPQLAAVGLLLAVLGNIMGTYVGWLCAQVCRWVS